MTWTAPDIERVKEPYAADEPTTLVALLAWSRRSLLVKCAGLTGSQLAERAVPPSELSLLGLVRHCADVERHWFRRRFLNQWQTLPLLYEDGLGGKQSFSEAEPATAQADHSALLAEWQAVDGALADVPLDATYEDRNLGTVSLRWIYQHVVAEYQRHSGHADLLRERIDGAVGH